METWNFVFGLFFITMFAFLVWAFISKKRTQERLEDPDTEPSSLATDGPGPNPATAPRTGKR
jgi:hypothetical protein